MDGPSPGSVQAVASIDNVVLASGSSFRIYRTENAEGPWSDTSFVESGSSVFIQAVDSLVFASDGNRLYRSVDRGLTWKQTGGEGDLFLPRRIFRSNGSMAMAMDDGRYFSSSDEGITWKPYQQSPSGYAYGHLLIHDSLTFAGTDDGIYVSANHGGSWRRLRGGLPAGQVILLERLFGKLFIAIVGQGLFASSNQGETWSKLDGGLTEAGVENMRITGLAAGRNLMLMACGGPNGVMGSRDSGKTWTPLNQGLPSTRTGGVTWYTAWNVVFREDTAFASTSAGVYRSTNGGAQWSPANQGLPPMADAFVSLCPAGTDLYAAPFSVEGGPAYRSSDGGRTWKKADNLLDGLRLMRTQGNDWFAMTDKGMVRSTDGGNAWTSLPGPWISSQGPIAFDFRNSDLAVAHHFEGATLFHSSDKGDTWNAEVDSRPIARWNGLHFQAVANRLRTSSNAGRTWTYLPMEFPEDVNALQAGSGLLALLSGSGLYVSADSGLTWRRPGGLLENLPVNSLTLAGSRFYAATGKGLMLSLDGGAQWKVLKQGLPVAQIQGIAANEGRLFVSDNQGLHVREGSAPGWKTLADSPADIQHLAVWKNIVLAATLNGKLFISIDAGATWKPTGESISLEPVLSVAVGSNHGFVSRNRGMFRTSDSGKTWEPVASADLVSNPSALAHGSEFLYAATGSRVLRSGDGGLHWSSLALTSGWTPRYLAAEGDELYGADGTGVYSSGDRGDTWTWAWPRFNGFARMAYSGGRVYISAMGGKGLMVLDLGITALRDRAPEVSDGEGIRLNAEGIHLGRQDGTVKFRFDLQGNGWVTFEIHSLAGKRIGAYASPRLAPGSYAYPWKLPGSHTGLFYRAEIRREDKPLAPVARMGRLIP